uniref:Uncharacterized protein n=1 Tax=Siphoviridae sp. ct3pR10 TaxID=2826284 RepID=A0A8S5LWQ3_9CAUD|nr:MAG TPA: hypothetical protein [Siphoviridae sp. ct3pR10]
MAESFNLLRRVKSLDTAPETDGYSGVLIFAGQNEEGNNIEYFAGDRSGKVLEITNEWGSQAQADAIYRKIRGFRYQPYKAAGTTIDPSVEIGDAVTIADTYGGVFLRATDYRDTTSDLEAPSNEEIEHEFQIQSPTNRQYERFTRSVRSSLSITATKIAAEVEAREAADKAIRATLSVQADAIEARVTKVGGSSSSFGWKLLNNSWTVSGNGKEIFTVDRNGAKVEGEIRATSGKIGGFDIQKNYLSYNGQTWGGTNTRGCYIGSSGIQLGKNFKVDMSGELTASSGRFEGTVYAGSIDYGGDAGYFSGSGLSGDSVGAGKIVGNSLSTGQFTEGVNASLGYADYANGVFNGWNTPYAIGAEHIYLDGNALGTSTISYMDGNGSSRTLNVVVWRE